MGALFLSIASVLGCGSVWAAELRFVDPPGPQLSRSTVVVTVAYAVDPPQTGIHVEWYLDGKLLPSETSERGVTGVVADARHAGTVRRELTLAEGSHLLRVELRDGSGASLNQEELELIAPGKDQRPALFVLVVGIDRYSDPRDNLRLARKDAESVGQALESSAGVTRLFRSTQVIRLFDEAATRAGITSAFTQLTRLAASGDVVIAYFSGHGTTGPSTPESDRSDEFFFLPHEVRSRSGYGNVWRSGLTGTQIGQLFGAIPAAKKLLIYDSCHSGEVVLRGPAETERQALAMLARARGVHVLAAATAQQKALELDALGHGLMTHALLRGLGGAAASDGIVTVRSLMAYVERVVPELGEKLLGKAQWPLSENVGQDFPLAVTEKLEDSARPRER